MVLEAIFNTTKRNSAINYVLTSPESQYLKFLTKAGSKTHL